VSLLAEYAVFNPHLQAAYHDPDVDGAIPRQTADWHKWRPQDPTSPHWYSAERLQALIAAYVTDERQGGRARTVRELVAEFHGLSGSVKPRRVVEAAGLSRTHLHDLIIGNDVALEPVTALLAAMQGESRPVKPAALGVLGEAHVHTALVTHYGVDPESFKYRKVEGVAEGLPFVLELACGFYGRDAPLQRRRIVAGVNWTPALRAPFPELPHGLGEARVDSFDPVVVVVHLAMPRPEFTDRGKSTLTLPPEIETALKDGIARVTKPWTGLKRQADRDQRVRERAREHYLKQRQRQYLDIKQAAYQVMPEVYAHASGALGMANARQVMYVARPLVLNLTGGKCWKRSDYFTQTLLPNFIAAHPELTASWDVVFDDRGHLIEPHTRHRIGLGTVAVRGYIREWSADVSSEVDSPTLEHRCPTRGPANRYTHALFIEKEGFYPLLEAVRIAERWDLAVMSTKGMTVTAARQLVEALSAQGVTILVCHDFDKSGFSILHTLQSNTRRYRFKTRPKVIDLGLRLADVHAMRLEREAVDYRGHRDPRVNLRKCGATTEECAFLVRRGADGGWTGDRVELNAMTSDQFIAWLERKLAEAGVRKVIPDQTGLANAYRRAVRQQRLEAAIEEALSDLDEDEEITIPDDLDGRIRAKLDGSVKAWDEVLRDIILGD
jgi:hypothetical protein